MQFLDGATLLGLQSLNKPVKASLSQETHVLSVDKPRFIHGAGLKSSAETNGSPAKIHVSTAETNQS